MSKKRLRSASAADKFLQTATEPIENKEQITNLQDEENQKETKKEKINFQTKEKEFQNSKIGQPKKYDEPTKHISFSLPVSVIENLKIISGLKKMNQTQLILSLINAELEKEADKIEAYKKLLI